MMDQYPFTKMMELQDDIDLDVRCIENSIFGDVEDIVKPFRNFLMPEYASLLEQLFISYQITILDSLKSSCELRDEISKLKKINAAYFYTSNLHHFNKAFRLAINATLPNQLVNEEIADSYVPSSPDYESCLLYNTIKAELDEKSENIKSQQKEELKN